ncbi:MAG: hypothetical protein II272_03870 [Oscillospiraceae bacterium]|nr:hypothetical protein [Oscillospiraceae bacterium]
MRELKRKKFYINSDNIQKVNNHLKWQFRINRRRDRTAPIARFVSVLLYLASTCLLFYGIGCQIDPSMSTVPVLSSIWEMYYSYLPIFDMAWYFSLLAMILTIYVPIFVVPIIIYLLACLLYHPKAKFETPSGCGYEQAHILVENHKKANSYPKVPSWMPSISVSLEENLPIIFSVVSAVIPALCSVIIVGITSDNKFDAIVGGAITFALIGLALWLISLPYWMWLVMTFLSHVKDKYRYAIDEFLLANDEEEAARREEAAKARADAAHHRREEAIASMAQWWQERQKESEDYKKRLHEWATDDDAPTPGSGKGI